jgi:hypothetical protein
VSAVLKHIINDIKNEQNSLFMEYLDNYLSERNYTPEENQNALKNKYKDILDFFRKRLESENNSNHD